MAGKPDAAGGRLPLAPIAHLLRQPVATVASPWDAFETDVPDGVSLKERYNSAQTSSVTIRSQISGSNCRPRNRIISAFASSIDSALRYGLSLVIASKVSANMMIRE